MCLRIAGTATAMRPTLRWLAAIVILMTGCSASITTDPPRTSTALVAVTDGFEFRSDPLFNLHDFLIWNAESDQPINPRPECTQRLSLRDQEAYRDAQTHYANLYARGQSPGVLGVALLYRVAGFADVDVVADSVLAPTLAHLQAALYAYRSCWWADHDARNRRWIAAVVSHLRVHEADLRSRHLTSYRAEWEGRIPVDVAGYVSWAGASSLTNPDHIRIASADPRYQEAAALEMVFHEASHTLLGPGYGDVWEALVAAATTPTTERAPHGLWHPIIFFTSGTLTAARLNAYDNRSYRPYMYSNRVFEQYWVPLERHWLPYLEGEITLEEAAARLVAAVSDTHR